MNCALAQVRLLPCGHYFHRDCIDHWFRVRAYQQRCCPLCKRDPLEGQPAHLLELEQIEEELGEEIGEQIGGLEQMGDEDVEDVEEVTVVIDELSVALEQSAPRLEPRIHEESADGANVAVGRGVDESEGMTEALPLATDGHVPPGPPMPHPPTAGGQTMTQARVADGATAGVGTCASESVDHSDYQGRIGPS